MLVVVSKSNPQSNNAVTESVTSPKSPVGTPTVSLTSACLRYDTVVEPVVGLIIN